MFTSRAEYRLHLRADNADLRLTEKGAEVGLVEAGRLDKCLARSKLVEDGVQHLDSLRFAPEAWGAFFLEGAEAERDAKRRPHKTASELLAMPHADFDKLKAFCAEQNVDLNVAAEAEDTVAAQVQIRRLFNKAKAGHGQLPETRRHQNPRGLGLFRGESCPLSLLRNGKNWRTRGRGRSPRPARFRGLTPASLVPAYTGTCRLAERSGRKLLKRPHPIGVPLSLSVVRRRSKSLPADPRPGPPRAHSSGSPGISPAHAARCAREHRRGIEGIVAHIMSLASGVTSCVLVKIQTRHLNKSARGP